MWKARAPLSSQKHRTWPRNTLQLWQRNPEIKPWRQALAASEREACLAWQGGLGRAQGARAHRASRARDPSNSTSVAPRWPRISGSCGAASQPQLASAGRLAVPCGPRVLSPCPSFAVGSYAAASTARGRLAGQGFVCGYGDPVCPCIHQGLGSPRPIPLLAAAPGPGLE